MYSEAVREHPFESLWVDCLIKLSILALRLLHAHRDGYLLPTPHVIVHQYFQSGLLSLAVRIGDCVTVGQGVHAGELATLAPHLVHCAAYGKHPIVPLLHLDIRPDIHEFLQKVSLEAMMSYFVAAGQ